MPNRRSPSTLNCWNKAWLICGQRVVCRSCGEGQHPMIDETPFRHGPTCNVSGQEAQFPWKDLNSILRADCAEVRQKLH
jgi:hypothetical protein